jgi:hypothetical protein
MRDDLRCQVQFDEFGEIFREMQSKWLEEAHPEEFFPFARWRASDSDLQRVERELMVQLPSVYKNFMRQYGGGQFLCLDLLPVISADDNNEDVLTVNLYQSSRTNFIAVAPVGTGDWWGFSHDDGICRERVDFLDHEDNRVSEFAPDFLAFIAKEGLGRRSR